MSNKDEGSNEKKLWEKSFNEKDMRQKRNKIPADRKTILLSAAMLVLSAVLLFVLGKQLWELKDIPKPQEITHSAVVEETAEPDADGLPFVTTEAPAPSDTAEQEYEEVKTFGLEPGQTVTPSADTE